MKCTFLDKVKNVCKQNDWTFEETKNGHWKFFSPDGKTIIVVSGTPSDWRAEKKVFSQFKRHGLIIK